MSPPSAGQGHRTSPHQAPHTAAERQGRAIPPHRLGGVLPAAGEPGHRRRQSLQQQLQEWEDSYNYHRPHGVLAGQTPCERLRQKAQDPLP
ncbi:integrase core domain-containing protein [Streptomyces nigra]|uniref:integrase core domain-containing protein n=1 Tax=Streptomyces nigra TaxID=1827580 RepID=UPI0036AF5848